MVRLKNIPLHEWGGHFSALHEPSFRVSQVKKWVFGKRLDSFENMHNISKQSRIRFAETFSLEKMHVERVHESANGDAVKFGMRCFESDHLVEAVLLIDRKRRTACISSQIGCALGCTFCATGQMGFVRNCTLDEIVGQLIAINDYLATKNDKLLTHIVFMGMGEALFNFERFCETVAVLNDQDGFGLAHKRITVSTAGVVPAIDKLIADGPPVNLAISLNAATDEARSAIMPVNNTYPIGSLIGAAKRFIREKEMALTFEYVVVHGENDTPRDVSRLVKLLHGVPCKVNCISLNPHNRGEPDTIDEEAIHRFADSLYRAGITATVRRSRGRDISGACGQLCTTAKRDNAHREPGQ